MVLKEVSRLCCGVGLMSNTDTDQTKANDYFMTFVFESQAGDSNRIQNCLYKFVSKSKTQTIKSYQIKMQS